MGSNAICLIVNPQADRGYARKALPGIQKAVARLGMPFSLQQTEAPGHGRELARTAAQQGCDCIVAVGGDGTCNEVVNGLVEAAAAGHPAALGIIPIGSGNDLAYALKIPSDIEAACAQLMSGTRRQIDLGRVVVDGETRYFGNNVGLGLDAEVNVRALQVKRLSGFAKYLWSVLQVIAFGSWPYCLKISLLDQPYCQPTTLITIANGVRAGGGFLLTPDARLDDGLFDICHADQLSKPKLLGLLPKTLNGTHTRHAAVTITTTPQLTIVAEGGVPAHIDGEILCQAGKAFEFQIKPAALTVWA